MVNVEEVTINLGKRSYPIYITGDYKNIGKCLEKAGIRGKIVVVTDKNVDKLQLPAFMKSLKSSGYTADKYVIKPGEESKQLKTLEDIYKHLIELRLDRGSTLVALGGGVVGDITGFVAATYLRGINFIQVPTTLLAQVDSSVGGKTGIDYKGSKNIIGAFYQPKLVYININSLKTLPVRQLKSGLAEVIKHGIISSKEFFRYINDNMDRIFKFEKDVLSYVIKTNCLIKSKVVEQDEKEEGLRAILNFGHTIGHAIESASGFRLLHGESIAVGMIGACIISKHMDSCLNNYQKAMVDKDIESDIFENTLAKVRHSLEKAGLPITVKDALEVARAEHFHAKLLGTDVLQDTLEDAIKDDSRDAVKDDLNTMAMFVGETLTKVENEEIDIEIEITPEEIYNAMYYDKKAKDGRLLFILTREIGDLVPCFVDDTKLIKNTILEIIG